MELKGAALGAYLTQQCGEDTHLSKALESLLKLNVVESFLANSPVSLQDEISVKIGRIQIDHFYYLIMTLLGR